MPAASRRQSVTAPRTAPPRRRPRPRSSQAGVELARSGGPEAVVLREVTRMVGVVPNTAYRHFADRDALLAAVRDEAVGVLARRMAERMSEVRAGPHTPTGARLRLRAVGRAYLEFARTEPGLFDTAFASPITLGRSTGPARRGRWSTLQAGLDNLVDAGILGVRSSPGHRVPDLGQRPWARGPPPRTPAVIARARQAAPRGPDARVHRGVDHPGVTPHPHGANTGRLCSRGEAPAPSDDGGPASAGVAAAREHRRAARRLGGASRSQGGPRPVLDADGQP